MLRLENIALSYQDLPVLQDVNCSLEKEDFVVLVGPNGAGKSSLLDIISGKIQPDSGHVFLDNEEITYIKEVERAAYISRLLQNTDFNTFNSLSVANNLTLAMYRNRSASFSHHIKSFPKHIIRQVLRPLEVDLEPLLDWPAGSLSLGQRQILAFIMAIIAPPKLLLLDEPTTGLDAHSATILLQFAARYIKRYPITTILITQDPQLALTLGNKLWIMKDGTITHQYNQEEKKHVSLEHIFGSIDYKKIAESIT